MQIELNGALITTAALTLAELIEEQGFDATSVASAMNGAFVPRASRAAALLFDGVRVDILSPMQGG